ncbi:MAG: efflux RND transporter periplasmic adaptor subunit [Deltaproteobacteria bacterium]|nr:efflux RND transporter periplasmic adaptor subunit [Deltaproteobacteria bacterium]
MKATELNHFTAYRHGIVYILIIIIFLTFLGCGKNENKKGDKSEISEQSGGSGQMSVSGQMATEVSAITVKPEDMPVTLETTGKTESYREVEVRTQVTGTLLKRFYTEGNIVKKGNLLFQIDPAPFQTAVNQAKANVMQQQASADKADRDIERLRPLLAEKAVSQQKYDDAVSTKELAQATLEQAVAALQQAEINLNYTKITAPISGITGKALKDEGSIVTAGSDSLLAKIHQIDPIYVNYSTSDTEYLTMRKKIDAKAILVPDEGKFNVELTLSDGSIYPRIGELNYMDSMIEAQTGTIQYRAEFANPDSILIPNQFVRATLKGAIRPNTILVPQRAVQQSQAGHYVYIVNNEGKAEQRMIEVGDWNGDNWIIESGLVEGDIVVVEGTLKIQSGIHVKTVPISKASTVSGTTAVSEAHAASNQ